MKILNKLHLEILNPYGYKTSLIDAKSGIVIDVVAMNPITHKSLAEEIVSMSYVLKSVIGTLEREYAYLLATMPSEERNTVVGQGRLASLRGALIQATGEQYWEVEERVEKIASDIKLKL